jgi:hypothetical protein
MKNNALQASVLNAFGN